ncbi:aminotransferase class I/II-fold pyridoxal phosphate-dependent enzyme [Candidatus Roizmanbacteria bacterium]|nr:aminotransferase class I/II-fold pyridoxal phosphate-dependent enzyme [Candidatus Roizmanbacteria bacterium]
MKNNFGNYTHQVDNPGKFIRFDLTEGECWFKDKVNRWLKKSDISDFIHYPDEKILKIKILLARWLHVKEENITTGSGSDELIEMIPSVFTKPKDEALTVVPSFFRFIESSTRAGIKIKTVRLLENNCFEWNNSVTKNFLKKAVNKKTKLIWLASPNNPTGVDIPKNILIDIIKTKKLIILDKVLNGFTKELRETSQLIWKNPNLIVLSSFSKTFGLPGLRFGFAIGSAEKIALLEKRRLPFNVSGPSLLIVNNLLESLLKGEIKIKEGPSFINERLFLENKIKELTNIKIMSRSKTNFLLLKPTKKFDLFKKLLGKGILVTDLSQSLGIKNKHLIRMTLRTREDNMVLINSLKNID